MLQDSVDFQTLEKIVQNDKKITKNRIKEIKIDIILNNLDTQTLSLKQAAIIILGIAKVISKRLNYMLEECRSYLRFLGSDNPEMPKKLKVPSARPITLEIRNNVLVIEDEFLELEDRLLVQNNDIDMLGSVSGGIEENPIFELDFGENSIAEQARDSTILGAASFIHPDLVNLTIKRRKLSEDERTEIDEILYKGDLKAVSSIVSKGLANVSDKMAGASLKINDQILKYFEKWMINENPVEAQREGSTLIEGNIEFNHNIDEGFQNDVDFTSIEDEKNIEADIFPDKFVFNLFCNGFSASEKAKSFYDLLSFSSQGIIRPEQASSFSDILCIKL